MGFNGVGNDLLQFIDSRRRLSLYMDGLDLPLDPMIKLLFTISCI